MRSHAVGGLRLLPVLVVGALAAALAAQAGAETVPPGTPEALQFWEVVKAAGLPGGLISTVLAVALLVILDCALAVREVNFCPQDVAKHIERLLDERRFLDALEYCRAEKSVLARAVEHALLAAEYGHDHARRVADRAIQNSAFSLAQRATYLAVLGAIACLFGFYGFFTGAIETFSVLQRTPAPPPGLYAPGIYQALVVPLEGTLTAVVCLLGFFIFAIRAHALRLRTALSVAELLGCLQEAEPAARTPGASSDSRG